MNRPDDNFDDLEQRLHAHFEQRADELVLEPREWTLEHAPSTGRNPGTAGVSTRRSTVLVAASVVALVAAGVGGTIMVARGGGSESSGADAVITAGPEPAPGNSASCPDSTEVPEPPTEGWPNDFRSPGLLLPAAIDGYCVIDHIVSPSIGYSSGPDYTVWTDCGECDAPSVAVALVADTAETAEWDPRLSAETVSVGERTAQYYPPGNGGSRFRLYTVDPTGEPVAFTGWGLDREEATEALDEILDAMGEETAPGPDPVSQTASGLQEIYSGVIGPYSPDDVPFAAEIGVGYWAENGGENLGYSVQRFGAEFGPILTPPSAWLFAEPGSHLTTIDGRTVAVLGPSDGWNGQRTDMVMVLDVHTAVKWSHDAPEPMTASELVAIELSPADATDPRWDEIAYESGQYDAVG